MIFQDDNFDSQPNSRLQKEANSFDQISETRFENGKYPDIRRKFFNPYFYNNIWRSSEFVKKHYGESANWIITELQRNRVKKATEFGCGDGWLTLELARSGFHVDGVDVSSKSIMIAQKYLSTLDEKKDLKLNYYCSSAVDFKQPLEAVICHGFLHHLPLQNLDNFLLYIKEKMPYNASLVVVEPRYDQVNLLMTLLVYVLRKALPSHFNYEDNLMGDDLKKIKEELSEEAKNQSEMDNESTSMQIEQAIEKHFKIEKKELFNAFFDKVIGSLRVNTEDEKKLVEILKELDNLIVQYSTNIGKGLRISAVKK